MHLFLTPANPFDPKFENLLALHRPNFARNEPRQRANNSCEKCSPKTYVTYPLSRVHSLLTDDRRQRCHKRRRA